MSNLVNNSIKTKQEAETLRRVVDELSADVYRKIDFEKLKTSLEERFPQEWVNELMLMMKSENPEANLKKLSAELAQLDLIKVKLAFEPAASFIEEIVGKLREKFGEKYIVELEIDHGILGGVILEVAGRFYDSSLMKLFEKKYDI